MKKTLLYLALILISVGGFAQGIPIPGNTVTKTIYADTISGINPTIPYTVDKGIFVKDTFKFPDGTRIWSANKVTPDSSKYVTYNGFKNTLDSLGLDTNNLVTKNELDSLNNSTKKRTYFKYTPDYPYLFDVWQDEGDTMYYTNFNWKQEDTAIKGDTLWFSPTGIDSVGRGSLALPLKSLYYAYINYPNAKKYYLLSGTYKYENGFMNTTIGRDLSIKKWQNGQGKVLITTQVYPSTTKKAEATNVYKYYSTDSNRVMIDTMVKDSKGLFKPLLKIPKVLSILDITPGSYYWLGDTIYYTRYLNTSPTSDSGFFVQSNIATIRSNSYYKLYMEDLTVWGGSICISTQNPDTLRKKYVTAVNCIFSYSSGDILLNAGNVFSAYNKCFANYGDDGFNYEDDAVYYNSADGFEYYGQAYYNTSRLKSSSLTINASNGSTSHRLSSILRVGGIYENSMGPNVADINGAISINIGVKTAGSTGSTYPVAEGIPIGFECGTINSVGSTDRRVYASGAKGVYINCQSTDSIGLFTRNGNASVYNFVGDTIVPPIASTPPANIKEDFVERSNFSLSNGFNGPVVSNAGRSGNYNDLLNKPSIPEYDTSSFLTFPDTNTTIATKHGLSLKFNGSGYTSQQVFFGGTDGKPKQSAGIVFDSSSSTLTTIGSQIVGISSQVGWNGRSRISSSANSMITVSNTAGTNFDRFIFGVGNSSFPELKVLGNGLGIKTADDLLFTRLTVGGLRIDSIPQTPSSNYNFLVRDTNTGEVKKVSPNLYTTQLQAKAYAKAYVDSSTGGISYMDTTYNLTPKTVSAGVVTTIQLDSLNTVVYNTERPLGINKFYSHYDSTIVSADGNWVDIMIYFKVETSTLNQSIDVFLDIGGAVGELYRQTYYFRTAGETKAIMFSLPSAYSRNTFAANGAKIKVVSANDFNIVAPINVNVDLDHRILH